MEVEGKDNKHKRQNIQSITATRAFDARYLLVSLSMYFGININLMTPRNFTQFEVLIQTAFSFDFC
jgi:hypothetical protein